MRASLNGIEIEYQDGGQGLLRRPHRGRHAGTARPLRGRARGDRRSLAGRLRLPRVLPGAPRDGARPRDLRLGPRLPQRRGARGLDRRAQERAAELEAKGLDALAGRSREMREAMGHHRSAQGLAHAARGMLAQEGSQVIDGLGSIGVPTLIIVGDQDRPFIAPCEYMAKKIPGARLEVIPGAGHSANLDQPEAFNRALSGFLGSLPAP